MLDIFFDSIEDSNTRDAFRKLTEALKLSPFLKGQWTFKEISVTSAATNKVALHKLGFKPKDIILLSRTGTGTVTFNNDLFDANNFVFSTSAPTTFRVLIGSHNEGL